MQWSTYRLVSDFAIAGLLCNFTFVGVMRPVRDRPITELSLVVTKMMQINMMEMVMESNDNDRNDFKRFLSVCETGQCLIILLTLIC